MKTCTKCKTAKPKDAFSHDGQRPDGLHPYCRSCRNDHASQYRAANPKKVREIHRKSYQTTDREKNRRNRAIVLAHYGQVCACCGSTERLNIDHVNGDGKQHRAEIGQSGPALWRWLIANGFPESFQTLCWPCNRSKSTGAHCRLNHAAVTAA